MEIGVGLPLPVEREGDLRGNMQAKTPDELMKMGMLLLQSQIEKLTKKGKAKALTAVDNKALNDCIRTLHATTKKEYKNEAERKKDQAEKAAVETELKRLSRKDLLELVLPHLEALGVDVVNLKFISKKEPDATNEPDDSDDDSVSEV